MKNNGQLRKTTKTTKHFEKRDENRRKPLKPNEW